jgi:hypothetical protein
MCVQRLCNGVHESHKRAMHARTRAKTAQALDAKAAVSGEAISQQKVATWVKWAAAGREVGQHANGRVQLRAGKATSLGELDEHACK